MAIDLKTGKEKVCPYLKIPVQTPNGQAYLTFPPCLETQCQWYFSADRSCAKHKQVVVLERLASALEKIVTAMTVKIEVK